MNVKLPSDCLLIIFNEKEYICRPSENEVMETVLFLTLQNVLVVDLGSSGIRAGILGERGTVNILSPFINVYMLPLHSREFHFFSPSYLKVFV